MQKSKANRAGIMMMMDADVSNSRSEKRSATASERLVLLGGVVDEDSFSLRDMCA
jgi:hypothetical protein